MIQEDHRTGTPRDIFRQDLLIFLDQIKTDGDKTLIMGDFNEVFHPDSILGQIAADGGIIDLTEASSGHQHFNTHARNLSDQRIDFALGSPDLLPSITKCGYQPIGKNYKGDHRGFYIDFDTEQLFGTQVLEVVKPMKRGIQSKDKKNRARYVQAKFKELDQHNFL